MRIGVKDKLDMKTIGVTGGVGAGKTQILAYIQEHYNCRILRADEVAHLLERPGEACYAKLVDLFGKQVLSEDGSIDKKRMAEIIFTDKEMLEKTNAIIHPEVKKYIVAEMEKERQKGKYAYFFVEAALLIEDHYDEILDEMWYIYTDETVRKQRLMENRHYSAQKVSDICRGQLSETEFRKHCDVEIENNGNLEVTYEQIRKIMGETV